MNVDTLRSHKTGVDDLQTFLHKSCTLYCTPLMQNKNNRTRLDLFFFLGLFQPFWLECRGMSPTLSTPASPTPLTEDGDELLLELRGFLSRMSNGVGAATDPRQAVSGPGTGYRLQYARDTASALRLLRHLPASRQAVFEYFAGVLDVAVSHFLIRLVIITSQLNLILVKYGANLS